MKKQVYLAAVLCGLVCAACSSTTAGKGGGAQQSAETVAAAKLEPEAMQASDVSDSLAYRGKACHSSVSRRPDKDLPVVADEQGEQYFDNRITLHIDCEGKEVLHKDFTKQDFAPWVDEEFLGNSILEGLVYDTVTDSGIFYVASLCYPQTDLYIPFSICVTADGKFAIRREELMEDLAGTADSAR